VSVAERSAESARKRGEATQAGARVAQPSHRVAGDAPARADHPRRRPRGRLSPFGVLIVLGICNHCVLTGARVAVPLDALALGANAATVGSLMALFALLPMFFAIPAGRLADRVGVRGPMLAGSIGMASGALVSAVLPGLPSLFVTAMLAGFSFMAFQVAAQYATGEMGGPAARTRNFGLLALGYSTSSIMGPLIAGFLIDHAGHRAAFGLLALVPLIPIAVLAADRIPFPGPHPAHKAHAQPRALDLVADGHLRRVFVINGMIALAWELHTMFVPLYGNAIGLSASKIGLILAAFAAATFTIRLSMPWLAPRVPEHRVLTSAVYLAAIVYLAIPFSRSVPMLMVLSFFLGLGLGAGQPMVMSLLHSLAPPGRMGEAAGIRMSLMNSMAVAVPLVFGAVGGTIGLAPMLWSVGVFLATGGWLTRGAKRSG
jgi:MFS family permease